MFQSKLCESPALGSACCACEKTTQDFFFFFFPFQGDKWERGSASETLCWTNISHWSTPSLRYWYSLQSLDPGYKTHPLSSCSSWMAGSSYTPPLLQTHTQTHTHTHHARPHYRFHFHYQPRLQVCGLELTRLIFDHIISRTPVSSWGLLNKTSAGGGH